MVLAKRWGFPVTPPVISARVPCASSEHFPRRAQHDPPPLAVETGREDDRTTADQLWAPSLPTGFFAYTCGCLVVVEDLHSGSQQHWLGHPEEISTLALSHSAQVLALRPRSWCTSVCGSWRMGHSSGPPSTHSQEGPWTAPIPLTTFPMPPCQVLASASGCGGTSSCCQIRIWDVPGGSCQQLLSHHCTAVQALAFSLDDKLLVTLGQLGGCRAEWSLDFPACPGTLGQLV